MVWSTISEVDPHASRIPLIGLLIHRLCGALNLHTLCAKFQTRLTVRCPDAGLAEAGECIEPVSTRPGADAHEFEESHQALDSRRIDGMFGAACVGFGIFRTELQCVHEKLFKHPVTSDHLPCYVAPGRCKSDKTVGAVIDKTPSCEGLERACNRGALHVHLIGDILCPCNTVGLLEMEDHLEIVFQAGGQPLGVLATEHLILSTQSTRYSNHSNSYQDYFILALDVKQIERLPQGPISIQNKRVFDLSGINC